MGVEAAQSMSGLSQHGQGLCCSISGVLQTVLRLKECFLRPRGHGDIMAVVILPCSDPVVRVVCALKLDIVERQFLERLHPAMSSVLGVPWWENSDGLGIFRTCASWGRKESLFLCV